MAKLASVSLIGCGPGSADYLTTAACKAAAQATLLCGCPRLQSLFPDFPGERLVLDGNLNEFLAEIEERAERESIAVLVTGDAGLFSLAATVIKRLGRERCRVVPGISAVQVACARLGRSWQNGRVVNVHHGGEGEEVERLSSYEVIAVLTGPDANWDWIQEAAAAFAQSYDAFLFQDLTLPEETIDPLDWHELIPREVSSRTIVLFARKSESGVEA